MARQEQSLVILFADICGSSPMYSRVGDSRALELIGARLDAMASVVHLHGGTVIRSKGDDLLCTFADADAAVHAALEMVTTRQGDDIQIRVGAHRGLAISARSDIFGDAVNVAARLLTIARPNEIVVTASVAKHLNGSSKSALRFFSRQLLKGQSSPIDLFSVLLTEDDSVDTPTVIAPRRTNSTGRQVKVHLEFQGREWDCSEGMTLGIGRSDSCDIVVAASHISREHATIEMRNGKAILNDRSSSGTWVTSQTGAILLRRESTFLVGQGEISLGDQDAGADATTIRYVQYLTAQD